MNTKRPHHQPGWTTSTTRLVCELLVMGAFVGGSTAAASYYGPGLSLPTPRLETWLDGGLAGLYAAALCLIVFLARRWRGASQRNRQLERNNLELLKTLAEVGEIRGCLPLCASCKKIQDPEREWHPVMDYLHDRLGTRFAHCVCPECANKLYPHYADLLHHIHRANGVAKKEPDVPLESSDILSRQGRMSNAQNSVVAGVSPA